MAVEIGKRSAQVLVGESLARRWPEQNVQISHFNKMMGTCVATVTDTHHKFFSVHRVFFDPSGNVTGIDPPTTCPSCE